MNRPLAAVAGLSRSFTYGRVIHRPPPAPHSIIVNKETGAESLARAPESVGSRE